MSEAPANPEGYVQGLNLAISLCLTYTLCIVLVRLWVRRGAFGADDLVVLVATIFTLGHTAADYVALANGLGKPWDAITYTRAISTIHGATISGIVLFWIALYISKLAVLTFLARMTKIKFQLRTYQACAAAMVVIGFVSVLVATVDCPSSGGFYWAFYDNRGSCPSQTTRWHVLTALDVATEIGLLVLPVQMVWSLQMPLRRKAIVLTAFYMRLPVIGLSLAREVYTTKLNSRDYDPSCDGAMLVIWLEIELAYALAANTLSALKAFTESFNSGFGQGFTRGKGSQYDMSDLSKDSGQSLKTEKRKSGSMLKSMSSGMTPLAAGKVPDIVVQDHRQSPSSFMKLRPENDGGNVTNVSADPARSWRLGHHTLGNDTFADDMVIMRETELYIHHDQAPMLGKR